GWSPPQAGTGRQTQRGGPFFRPVPGLPNAARTLPTAGAVGYYLSPFGLGAAYPQRRIFFLTYECLRSKFFVYGGNAASTDGCGVGNSDRALEPGAGYGAPGARLRLRTQAHAVHHGAEDAADHGGERVGTPRREAAGAHLPGRAAAGMDAAATGGR